MKVRISQLPDATSFTLQDLFLIVDKETLVTQKITFEQILESIKLNITGSELGSGDASIHLYPDGTISATGSLFLSGAQHQISGSTTISDLLTVSELVSSGDLTVSGNTVLTTLSAGTAQFSVLTSSTAQLTTVNIVENLTVGGNLVVNGTTYTVNKENTSISGTILVLGSGSTGIEPIGDRGIIFAESSSNNPAFWWSALDNEFKLAKTDSTIEDNIIEANEYSNLHVNVLTASNISASSLTISSIDVANLGISGNVQAESFSGNGSLLTDLTIGQPEDATYSDGLFTNFVASTPIGTAIDRINEVLKGLAPLSAPNLSNLEKKSNTQIGNSMKLSFDNFKPTGSYFGVTASLPDLPVVYAGQAFGQINGVGGSAIRLGIYSSSLPINLVLNNNVTQNAAAYINYPNYSYNVPENGNESYSLQINNIETITGSTLTTSSYSDGIFVLSTADNGAFIATGQSFSLFKHRTGTITIPTSSWRLGHNFAKVTHVSSLGNYTTNYIDWVYDPEISSNSSSYNLSAPESSSFVVSGVKYLSGIKYYTNLTYNFSCSIENYYKNCYPSANNGGITFTALNPSTGLNPSNINSIPVPNSSDDTLQILSSHTIGNIRLLGTSLSSKMDVSNGVGKNATTTLTTNTVLLDKINTSNSNTLENFCLENYRVISGNYSTQSEIISAASFPSASALSASELAVYSGGLRYPKRVVGNGNVNGSGIIHMISDQPDYSSATENRYYFRKFVNVGSVATKLSIDITGSNINFAAHNESLSGNAIKISLKVPGKTGWRDILTPAPGNTTGVELDNDIGALFGAKPDNLIANAGRTIVATLITDGLTIGENYLLRIQSSKDWAGEINKIQITVVTQ